MSAEYRPIKRVPFDSLFDCEFGKYGIRVDGDRDSVVVGLIGPNGTMFASPDGDSTHYERHLGVDTDVILEALSKEFDTEIVDEDDHRFWGFATVEEMKAACWEVSRDRARSEEVDGRRWIVVEGPSLADAEFTSRWLQAAIDADRLLEGYLLQDPDFRPYIRRLKIKENELFAFSAMLLVGMWFKEVGVFPLDLISGGLGEVACVMAAVGFFSQTGDRYQMTIPKHLTLDRIKSSFLQLSGNEAASGLRPERHFSAITMEEATNWQRRLRRMPWQQRLADRAALLPE
jgi:hypothetical protein